MDLTSRKEHHIIKCLGLAQREEKCGMSPADREEDLMLFIREHLPETAFSPFALDTAPLPLQSAHGRADMGSKRTALAILPPRFVPRPPPPPGSPRRPGAPIACPAPSPRGSHPTAGLGGAGSPGPSAPHAARGDAFSFHPSLLPLLTPTPPARWLLRCQEAYEARPSSRWRRL